MVKLELRNEIYKNECLDTPREAIIEGYEHEEKKSLRTKNNYMEYALEVSIQEYGIPIKRRLVGLMATDLRNLGVCFGLEMDKWKGETIIVESHKTKDGKFYVWDIRPKENEVNL